MTTGLVLLLPIALVVGTLIGAVGVGGILLIPALNSFAGLPIHEAMATALFTFIFTGITGTFAFQRRGSIDWRIAIPVCAGALFCAFIGAWVNSNTRAPALAIILAGVIMFAGIYSLCAWKGLRKAAFDGRPTAQWVLLLALGAIAGFGSGLTGVGGPALSVPLMVLFGFPALATIGTGQVIQIIAAISGTVGNLQYGSINFPLAIPIAVVEIIGTLLGARIVHAVNPESLRKFVALLCIAVGIFLLIRALH
ncbi:MAG TPA: sulfite exporter TauE/SafE family protein [Burkholderiales bacterium]|nr:sulfite exporter TauE/SafE family protein [Burkholderiales bacterium]